MSTDQIPVSHPGEIAATAACEVAHTALLEAMICNLEGRTEARAVALLRARRAIAEAGEALAQVDPWVQLTAAYSERTALFQARAGHGGAK